MGDSKNGGRRINHSPRHAPKRQTR
jgi:hypothetical protein